MAYISQVKPCVEKDGYKLYFLTGLVPEGSFERNIRFFVKKVLEETYEFETKRNIQTMELTDITKGNYPYLYVTKQDVNYIEDAQRNYLLQHYDSLLSFGDLNVVFYKLR